MADEMSAYEVVVKREDGVWLAEVPVVDGAFTFAHSLPSLRENVRQVITLMDDLPDDANPDVAWRFEVEDPALHEAEELGKQRQEFATREKVLQQATSAAARRLADAGYSTRDAAVLLHITPGRVSQINNADAEPKKTKQRRKALA